MRVMKLCQACHDRPAPTRQRWCPSCAQVATPTLSNKQAERVAQVCRLVSSKLHGDEATFVALAGQRQLKWSLATVRERIAIGTVLFGWCAMLEDHGLLDKPAEEAYRKLMGHDRRTGKPAPFPPISSAIEDQGLRSPKLVR